MARSQCISAVMLAAVQKCTVFMPRIRERKQQNQAISVTPWMTKKGSIEGAASSRPGPDKRQKLMYSVLLADAQLSASGLGPCDDTAALVTTAEPSPRSTDTIRTSPGSGEWHSVRRKPPHHLQLSSLAGNNTPASQAARDNISTQSLADKQISSNPEQRTALVGPPTAIHADPFVLASNPAAVEDDTGQQRPQFADVDQAHHSQQQPQQLSLHGVAQLILLPSGTIAGHFMAQYSSAGTQQQHHLAPLPACLCLGLHGKQVLGIHSCYRDPEWALLQMSIIRYSRSSNSSSSRADSKGGSSSSRPSSSSRSREGPEATLGGAADGAAAVSFAGTSHAEQADCCDDSRAQQQQDDQRLDQQQQQQQQQQRSHVQRLCVDSCEQSPATKLRADQHLVEQSHQLQTVSNDDPQATAAAAAVAGGAGHFEAAGVTSDDVTIDSDDASSQLDTAAAAAFDATDDASSSSTAAEAVAWVQRTGGDLVTLSPADLDDEDTLTVVLQDNLGLDPEFVHVDFKAKTLLAGATADDRLRIGWPHLVGQEGIVVNIGSMTLSNVPHGWWG